MDLCRVGTITDQGQQNRGISSAGKVGGWQFRAMMGFDQLEESTTLTSHPFGDPALTSAMAGGALLTVGLAAFGAFALYFVAVVLQVAARLFCLLTALIHGFLT